MKALFSQMAILLGGSVAALSLAGNLIRRMDLLTAVFRSALVFFATVGVLFLFLRFFSTLVVRFVAEQVIQQRNQAASNASATPPPPRGPESRAPSPPTPPNGA